MTKSRCCFMNSYWSSGDMKPTNTPMSLLTRDLAIRSKGSPGRDLVERLSDFELDLLGTVRPLEFAQALRSPAPPNRQVLEELLEWTALDNDFLLIALVALAPELEQIALRLSWARPSKDTVSEVLTQATIALRWTHELTEGERVTFVLEQALMKTRTEQRRMSRHNVPTTFIPDDYDEVEPEVESINFAPALLDRAVANYVISSSDATLIRRTRGDKKRLEDLAKEFGLSYDALRMRRTRAEDCLRRHYRVMDLR